MGDVKEWCAWVGVWWGDGGGKGGLRLGGWVVGVDGERDDVTA